MTTPFLIVMVGFPGVGKSTATRDMLKDLQLCLNCELQDIEVISSDRYIEAVARDEKRTYDQTFAAEQDNAERYCRQHFQFSVKNKRHIIVDRTNLTVEQRAVWLGDEVADYVKIAIVVPPPEPMIWMERLMSREGKTIPQQVLHRMRIIYVEPTEAEGFNKVAKFDPSLFTQDVARCAGM